MATAHYRSTAETRRTAPGPGGAVLWKLSNESTSRLRLPRQSSGTRPAADLWHHQVAGRRTCADARAWSSGGHVA